jgi:hypothetical protein
MNSQPAGIYLLRRKPKGAGAAVKALNAVRAWAICRTI